MSEHDAINTLSEDIQRRIAADPMVALYVNYLLYQLAEVQGMLNQVQINHMAAQTYPPVRSVN